MIAGRVRSLAALLWRVAETAFFRLALGFLRPGSSANPQQRRDDAAPSPTAYLDGLRGVAALVVWIYHLLYMTYPWAKVAYQASPGDTHFLQYPIVRIVHAGRSFVSVFFVISGYALSLRTVKLVRAGRFDHALEGLARSTFRRSFRLYVPIAVVTFAAAVMIRYPDLYVAYKTDFPIPPRSDTVAGQLRDWADSMAKLMDPYQVPYGRKAMYKPPYNLFLWTIPTEMKGSLYVFVLLLALVRTRPAALRLGVMACLICHNVRAGDYDMGLFGLGMALAELSLVLGAMEERDGPAAGTGHLDRARHVVSFLLLLPGLYMMGYPDDGDDRSPATRWMFLNTPAAYQRDSFLRQFFWNATGAAFFVTALVLSPRTPPLLAPMRRTLPYLELPTTSGPELPARSSEDERGEEEKYELDAVAADGAPAPETATAASPPDPSDPCSSCPLLRRPFDTRLARYLGRISYALYLVQAPVIQIVMMRFIVRGDRDHGACMDEIAVLPNNEEGRAITTEILSRANRDYHVNFVSGALISTVLVFWISDLFWRCVDRHASDIGKRAAKWCWVREI